MYIWNGSCWLMNFFTNVFHLSLFSGQWKRTRKKGKSFKDIMQLHSSIKPETPCISFDALMFYDPIRNTCTSAMVHFTLLCNKWNEFITIFWLAVTLHHMPSISSAWSHLTWPTFPWNFKWWLLQTRLCFCNIS